MGGKLQKVHRNEGTWGTTVAEYEFNHSSSEVSTILGFGVKIEVSPLGEPDVKCSASILFDGCEGATPEEALARLANWCERAAEELKKYKPTGSLPM